MEPTRHNGMAVSELHAGTPGERWKHLVEDHFIESSAMQGSAQGNICEENELAELQSISKPDAQFPDLETDPYAFRFFVSAPLRYLRSFAKYDMEQPPDTLDVTCWKDLVRASDPPSRGRRFKHLLNQHWGEPTVNPVFT
eukprot:CAMPEP_0113701304 /NCGR_PEP_ID=MMETSP0038_2-20120614/24491_1 /TAXON_ID=2898 /ORGANISM="Cryptomonas paramecium" /LENGTH=139 /DNA_ID=CAMNT_0000625163 /DNA_START=98 /DNA_END=517 /DNA_ORIENTATION=- /assembly_acc=CAM_ASM_000170